MRILSLLIAAVTLLISQETKAWTLKVHGAVTDYMSGLPMAGAEVRVYRDGVKVKTATTGSNGRYSFHLDNNARYVLRFGAVGAQGKCFTVDTHGLVWEDDKGVKEVLVEMVLFKRMAGMDLSYFDLPMGMARFQPATGLLTWDKEYDARIRTDVAELMAEYERRRMDLEPGLARATAMAGTRP